MLNWFYFYLKFEQIFLDKYFWVSDNQILSWLSNAQVDFKIFLLLWFVSFILVLTVLIEILQNFNKQQFVNQRLTRLLEQYAVLQKQHFYPSYSQYYSLLCISPSNEFDEIFIYSMHVAYVLTLDTPRADQTGLENGT